MASPARPLPVFQFGSFELDTSSNELRKGGIALKLHPQPYRVLLMLVERSGELVPREQIQQALWGNNTFVDFERGINFSINQIRAALSDDAANPRYIATVPRRGYKFIATVTAAEAQTGAIPFPSQGPATADTKKVPHTDAHPLPRSEEAPVSAQLQLVPEPVAHPTTLFARNWRVMALAGAGLLAVALAAVAIHLESAPKLRQQDTVVVVDFSNSTGDSVFDETLKQGVEVELSQSHYLNILSDQRVRETLKLMGRPAGERLTPETAQELCQRTGSKTYIQGSIAKLESQYVIGLRAVDCVTSETLAREQVTADGKERVLGALSAAVTSLRKKVGESLATLKESDSPLEQATTPSLEALRAYSVGREALIRGESASAIPPFERAVALDPNFAMAWASLSVLHARIGELTLSAEDMKKAYALREHTSEREKFYIEAQYYWTVPENLTKVRKTFTQWMFTYPRDPVPVSDLGAVDRDLGNLDSRLAENLKTMELDPGMAGAYYGGADAYLRLDRLDDARATVEKAFAQKMDAFDLHLVLFYVDFLKNDTAGMAHEVAWSSGRAGIEEIFLSNEASDAAYFGKLREADELWKRAEESAEKNGATEVQALYEGESGLAQAEFGDLARAQRNADLALSRPADVNLETIAAEAAGRAGESERAERMADEFAQQHPESTMVNGVYVPEIRAIVAMNRGRPAEAVAALHNTEQYELGAVDHLYSAYLRGLAYLRMQQGAAAAAEFERILRHPGVVVNDPIGALARLQLARAYRMEGEVEKSRAEYQAFLQIWKDADPDIPILLKAKAEYVKLQ